MEYNIKYEFGRQAKKFRLHFGLSQLELAQLTKMSASEYSDLEKGSTNYSVEKLQNVASVYGLKYFQMGNPVCNFPSTSNLPDDIKSKIQARSEPLKIYTGRLIVEHMTVIFGLMAHNTEFLVKDIRNRVEEKFQVAYGNEEIAGTIDKKFKEFIIKTNIRDTSKMGRGQKPFYYKLIKDLNRKTVEKAMKTIENVSI